MAESLRLIKPGSTEFRSPEAEKEAAPKGRILVADNNRVFGLNVATKLRAKGFHVDLVHHTDELFFKLHHDTYGLVITSNTMPMSGAQIMEEMKKDSNLENVPVMVRSKQSTIYAVESLGGKLSRIGTDDYVEQVEKIFTEARLELVE